jgi:hypothetical protein
MRRRLMMMMLIRGERCFYVRTLAGGLIKDSSLKPPKLPKLFSNLNYTYFDPFPPLFSPGSYSPPINKK